MQLRGLAAEGGDADRVLQQAARRSRGGRRCRRPEAAETPSAATSSARTDPTRPRQAGMRDLSRRGSRGTRPARPRRGAGRASALPGRPPVAASRLRTCTCSRPPNRSTRPSTRTASPWPKRWSSSSTSLQTRASTRPLGSTSSSARYDAPAFVRSRRLLATAYTPSTVRSSWSSIDRVPTSSGVVVGAGGRSRALPGGGRANKEPAKEGSWEPWVPTRRWWSRPKESRPPVGSDDARRDALSRRPLRGPVAGRGRSAVRRDRRRGAARSSRARDPHNVVHLTLGGRRAGGGAPLPRLARGRRPRRGRAARASGRCGRTTSGPTGSRAAARASSPRSRSSRTRPGAVLPHERTHAGPEGEPPAAAPRGSRAAGADLPALRRRRRRSRRRSARPDLAADGAALWRLPDADVSGLLRRPPAPDRRRPPPLRDRARLPRRARERRRAAACSSCSSRPPTPGSRSSRRTASSAGGPTSATAGVRRSTVEDALERLVGDAVRARGGGRLPGRPRGARDGRARQLDVELVDRYGHDGISYTPDWRRRSRRVDSRRGGRRLPAPADAHRGRLRAGARGEVLPQKTTYFFPKLLSGLLFLPLDEAQ